MPSNTRQNDQIDLVKVFKALWKHALSIILVTLIGGAIAFGVTFAFMSPKYKASAMLYVNNSSFSFGSTSFSISTGELNAANTLVDVYTAILKSRTTLEEIAAEAEVPYSYTTLQDMVSTSDLSGTGIFNVYVESSNPMEAEKIANTIARVLPDRIADIVDGASVRIVDYAIVPAHRSTPSYTKNTAIGLLLGFLVSAGFVAVKNVLVSQGSTLIQSADDLAAAYPELPLLATIPDMRSAGKKGYYYSNYYSSDTAKSRRKGAK